MSYELTKQLLLGLFERVIFRKQLSHRCESITNDLL